MTVISMTPTPPDPAVRDAPVNVGAPVPYIQRKIDVTFSLGTGNFGEQGQNVVTLRGLRCQATVTKMGVGHQTQCSLRIWGMRFSEMQKLSTYGTYYAALRHNGLLVEAGDDIAGMTRVFTGTITDAYFDGESQPEVAFQVEAHEGGFYALKPAPPISVAGAADVATIMSQLARQMEATFENHNVVTKLRDVYYPGTAYHQMRRIAAHAGINATLENGVLAIWPRDTARNTGSIPVITKLSGLRNYPTFTSQYITATCLFRPLEFGQQVAIESSLWNHKRRYYNVSVGYIHTLDSETPNGRWFTTFKGIVLGGPSILDDLQAERH